MATTAEYRVSDEHAGIIRRFTYAARLTGWTVRITVLPHPEGEHDSVEVFLGPANPKPLEHASVSFCTWTGAVTVRPGWALPLNRLAAYIRAYQARAARGDFGYDGLEAIYHAATGTMPRNS
jgi:hypothetical protein